MDREEGDDRAKTKREMGRNQERLNRRRQRAGRSQKQEEKTEEKR